MWLLYAMLLREIAHGTEEASEAGTHGQSDDDQDDLNAEGVRLAGV